MVCQVVVQGAIPPKGEGRTGRVDHVPEGEAEGVHLYG